MPIIYKVDVLNLLKQNGYNTYRMRQEKVLSEVTIQRLRENKLIRIESIETICKILSMQPGDLIEYVPDKQE